MQQRFNISQWKLADCHSSVKKMAAGSCNRVMYGKVCVIKEQVFILKLCLINILTIHNSIFHPPPRLPYVGALLLSMRTFVWLFWYLYGASSSGTAYEMWPMRPQAPATASEWFYFSLGWNNNNNTDANTRFTSNEFKLKARRSIPTYTLTCNKQITDTQQGQQYTVYTRGVKAGRSLLENWKENRFLYFWN